MSDIPFVCVHNAGRSQMAKAFFNRAAQQAGISLKAESAGTEPAERVHPVVAEAMLESGIDIRETKPRLMTDDAVRRAQYVITMGCAVDAQACPALLLRDVEDWGLPDPAGKDMPEVRAIRDEVERRVADLVKSLQPADRLHPHSFGRLRTGSSFPRSRGKGLSDRV
jgi:arsenate reductase